jgi:pyruvate,orthophosphate dikinase
MGVELGRKARPNLKVGSAESTAAMRRRFHFFRQAGLDYVSASPYRIPVRALAARRRRCR